MALGTVNISVRNMVEFVYRSGSIDSRYQSSARTQEGIRIHKKIQVMRKNMAKLNNTIYESEYTIKHSFSYKDCAFNVDGRADGIMNVDDKITIEEIKSTLQDIESMEDNPGHWHWAQAKCYGYMYCANKQMDGVTIMLTYCHVETEEHLSYEHTYKFAELEQFFMETVERYFVFASTDINRIALRNETAATLEFPFGSYRKGQRELAVSVYSSIKQGKNLFAHAPTGTGKTVSTVYPAVKALEKGLITKIFYLTSRNTNRLAALDCFQLLEEKGLIMTSILLTAKAKICFMDEQKCNPVDCPYANGHFDRVNEVVIEIIKHENIITKEIIEDYAKKHVLCPFELSLDLTLFCDCIICDYNYVYDPTAKLKRFFGEGLKNDFALLIDEAHNLVDRAREMYSAELSKADFTELSILFKNKKSSLKNKVSKVRKLMDEVRLNCESESDTVVIKQVPDEFNYALRNFITEADKWLASNEGQPGHEMILDVYFKVLDFLRILESYDERYCTMVYTVNRSITMKLLCLDPSYQLSCVTSTITSAVFFSATLNHMDFFTDVLGGEPGDYRLLLDSPFDSEKLCIMVNSTLSTKYRDREQSYENIAELIYLAVTQKRGNYIVFFSSYAYMKNVWELFSLKYARVKTITQVQGDKSGEFLEYFVEDNTETVVGFAVLGAGYSEGIDLTGDKLIGAVIVGVGLPMISVERDVIKEYYNEKSHMGYEYAYVYPGMNKVLQAAGRVIRKESDRGMVLLIDSRYLDGNYRRLFPHEWEGFKKVQTAQSVEAQLTAFWGEDTRI